MPKTIDYSRDDRAILEKNAFNSLAGDLKRTPTQEEVYAKAYGTPYVSFSSDFGLPALQKELGDYQKGAYDAYGNIRKGVVRPQREKAYKANISDILGQNSDPLTAQRLTQQVVGNRQNANNLDVQQRANQYNRERSNTIWDYLQAKNKQATQLGELGQTESAAAEAAKHDQDLNDYLWKAQVDAQLNPPRRSGSTGSGSYNYQLEKLDTVDENGNPVTKLVAWDPRNPTNITDLGSIPLPADTPAAGSDADLMSARAGVAADIQAGATQDEIKQHLNSQGYNPADFQDLIDSAPTGNAVQDMQTPGILQWLFGKNLFNKG